MPTVYQSGEWPRGISQSRWTELPKTRTNPGDVRRSRFEIRGVPKQHSRDDRQRSRGCVFASLRRLFIAIVNRDDDDDDVRNSCRELLLLLEYLVVPTTIERKIDCVTPQRILFCSHPRFLLLLLLLLLPFFHFWVFSKADFFTTDD